MTIREIQKKDNLGLAALIRAVFDEFNVPKTGTVYDDPETDHLFEAFENKNAVLFVVEEKNELMGACGIYPTKGLPNNCAELVKLYLRKETRGTGLGKKLLLKCLEWSKENGYHSIYLECFPEFTSALQLYKEHGFTRLDKPMGDSGHTACSVWMLKDLL